MTLLTRTVLGAPLTFAWLAILFVTTRRQREAGRHGSRYLQRRHSTNLRRLSREPSRVLASSLFWLDGRQWWPYVPLFVCVVAPAERRLRSGRWLLVGLAAHIVGTYAGQGFLQLQIRRGQAPHRAATARDVGVSYFVLGVLGALLSYVRRPWRSRWSLGLLTLLGGVAVVRPTFTEIGHLTAFGIGLAAGPLVPASDRRPPYPAFGR